jgi:hypothetical protein
MKRIMAALFGLLVTTTGLASEPVAARNTAQAEASMLITGWALIEADGSVSAVEFDQREKLPAGVVSLVEEAGLGWQFEPVEVDGVARKAKARMSLRIVARKAGADGYEVRIGSGSFGEAATPKEGNRSDSIKSLKRRTPAYPDVVLKAGVRGTVYAIVKVGRLGTVEEAFVEQVDLRAFRTGNEMKRLRDALANSTLSAVKAWTFHLPVEGKHAGAENWTVRIPVDYAFYGDLTPKYGEWDAYVPGPKRKAPWITEEQDDHQSPDSLVAGEVYGVGDGLRLLTPLQPGEG